MSNAPLHGKVAFITGASRGIGRAVAMRLAGAGCNVALVARGAESLAETEALCRALGVKTLTFAIDVADSDLVANAVKTTIQCLGDLHILVNNAGVMVQSSADTADLSDWERIIRVNLTAVMHTTRHALPWIEKAGGGSVIFIASLSGKTSHKGSAAYCASKHGVIGFAGSVFEDVREKGIKVSAICPGFVNTDMITGRNLDPEKMIQPEDVADAVLFVATFPATGCPTEIVIRPQRTPYIAGVD